MKKTIILFAFVLLILVSFGSAEIENGVGLVAYYTHNDSDTNGTSSRDISGNPVNNATITGATTGVAGVLAEAYSFDGTDDLTRITSGTTSIFENTTQPRSICMWAQTGNGSSIDVKIFSERTDAGRYQIRWDNDIVSVEVSGLTTVQSGTVNDTTKFFHICFTYNQTEHALYINGSKVSNVSSGAMAATTGGMTIGSDTAPGQFFNGTIDEVGLWNTSLTPADVSALYNDGNGLAFPFGAAAVGRDALNVSTPQPVNSSSFNALSLNINTTVNSSTTSSDFNCTLFINATLNQTSANRAGGINVAVNFTLNFSSTTESSFTYFLNCSNNETSKLTTTSTFFIDNIDPVITTNFQNRSAFFKNLTGQFNFTDPNLFSYNITIDGSTIDNASLIGQTSFTLNLNENIASFGVGPHNLTIEVTDGHTSREISNWDYDKGTLTNSITYNFGRDWIKIRPKGLNLFDGFDTNKRKDRYDFVHERFSVRDTETYVVESSRKITTMDNNVYRGWVVIAELEKWIDFESESNYDTVSFNVISDYEVEITLTGLTDKDLVFNSIGSLNVVTQSFDIFQGNVTTRLTTPIFETADATFTAIFAINDTFVSNINASFNWNNLDKGPGTKTVGTNQINFTNEFQIPSFGAGAVVGTFWNYTIFGVSNNESNQTSNQTQQIINIGVEACLQNNTNASLILIPRDEKDDAALANASVDLTLEVFINQENITRFNVSFEFPDDSPEDTNKNYTICLKPNNESLLVNAFISYSIDLYSQRNFFLVNSELGNNLTKRVFLYLINDSIDTDVTITLTDEDDDPLVERFIKVLRFFPGNNSFKTVEVARTSDEGKTVARLILNDVFYKFIIQTENETIFTSANQKVLSSELFIQITLEESFVTTIRKVENLDFSFTYNNATGVFLFVFTDLENIVREGRLLVIRRDPQTVTICDESVESTAGSLSCTINTSIAGVYLGSAFIDSNTQNSLFPIGLIETNLVTEFQIFGTTGLILQMFLLSVMIGVGIWRPSSALIFGLISVIGGIAVGFVGVTYVAAFLVCALIILLIGLIKD